MRYASFINIARKSIMVLKEKYNTVVLVVLSTKHEMLFSY